MLDGAPPGLAAEANSSERASLSKVEYLEIRSTLDLKPTFIPNLLIACLDALLLYWFAVLVRSQSLPAYCLAQVILAIVFFNAFSILHECGHGSASSSATLNVMLGHAASTFCFIPFYPWRYIHQKHHVWAGNLDRDPVLKSLRTWRDHGVPGGVRVAWRSWIPVGALLQHAVYLSYPYQMWRTAELTRPKFLRSAFSMLWMLASWFLLHRLLPDVVRFANLLPGILIFLFAEELVNAPHHVGMPTFDAKLPLWEQSRTTRSCYYPVGISELLVLNFNFHIEHHLFPDLPWFRLRRARAVVKSALGERYNEAIGIQWNLKNRSRDLQAIVDTR